MKLLKKTFALMLSLILVVGMIPGSLMTVHAYSTITDIDVNITEPVVGQMPVAKGTVNNSEKYKVKAVLWNDEERGAFVGGEPFISGRTYEAEVVLKSFDAEFHRDKIKSIKVNGIKMPLEIISSVDQFFANVYELRLKLHYTMPGPKYSKHIEIDGTRPTANQTPKYDYTLLGMDTSEYEIYDIQWIDLTSNTFMESTDKFIGGHNYYLRIWVRGLDDNTFLPVDELIAKVNGESAGCMKVYGEGDNVVVIQHEFSLRELEGSGTKDDPYVVYDEDDFLEAVAFDDVYVKLGSNITFNEPTEVFVDITIDLNNKVLASNYYNSFISIDFYGDLSLKGPGKIESDVEYYGDSILSIDDAITIDVLHSGGQSVVLNHPEAYVKTISSNKNIVLEAGRLWSIRDWTESTLIMRGGIWENGLVFIRQGPYKQNYALYGGRIDTTSLDTIFTGNPSFSTEGYSGNTHYLSAYGELLNSFCAFSLSGEVKKCTDMDDFISAAKEYGAFDVYAPYFAEQFPEMPAGKYEHNLGKVSSSEYVMTFASQDTPSSLSASGYKVIEQLVVYDRDNNGKIVDTVTNNPAINGTGISYSLKNLPSGNYTIRETIALYDKDGKAVLGTNNDFILEVDSTVNFTNQSPAMPDGASMQFINATEGESLTFTFDNEDVRSPYTVEKYLSLTGPGIASAETKTKGDSGALKFTRTFDQAGMYTLKEVLRLKNGSDTVKTKTHTFYIFVNEKPLVTPTITTQPNDVTNASGDSVTLTAKAENAERARWYVEKSDGTVTALGDAFAADGTSTQTISKANNAVGNRYFCAFWSVDGKIAKTDSVTVCFVPTVTNGSDVIVNEGTTAYLKVNASGCNHYADANGWYAPGASSEVSGSKYYPMGTTLCIKNVTEADEGTYTYKYVTEHGDVATGTVKLVVNTGSSSTTINTFDIFGLDNPMIIGTYADTTVSVPENANYTAAVIDCTFDDASGIVTSGSGTVTIKLTPNTGYRFKPSGNISGTIDGITKAFSRYEGSSIIVVVDYNDYSAWKIAYPANDTISISTDSLTFKVGTAANGQKVEGDYKCTHSGLADTNLHHTGMKYAVYSIEDNAMPAGLTLNADGTITGTPTTAGVYTVMVRADSVNANGTVSNCSGLAVKAIEIIVEDKDVHTHDTAVVSDTATCTTDGVKTLKCGCTVESPAKGHNYVATGYKDSTCGEDGYTEYKCTVCKDTNKDTIPATGAHTKDGSKCTTCGYDAADDCDCNCHAGGIKAFFFKIINFFQKLFGKNKVCECGAKH